MMGMYYRIIISGYFLFVLIIAHNMACKKTDPQYLPVLVTVEITQITSTTSVSGGFITENGSSKVKSRGVCWSIKPNPTIADSKTIDFLGIGDFVSNMSGLLPQFTYYVRAYATNDSGTAYGNELVFKTKDPDVIITSCPDTPIVEDIDGNIYTTVQIGEQCWMVQNLKTSKYNDGEPILNASDYHDWISLTEPAFCWYEGSINYFNTYGALYNWYAVQQGKLCPEGWFVPTNEDFYILTNFIKSQQEYQCDENPHWISKSLASREYWKVSTYHCSVGDDLSNNNPTGFSGLPSGTRCPVSGISFSIGYNGYWWSSSIHSLNKASSFGLHYKLSYFGGGSLDKGEGLSVRCLKK
jgi:uncharacterized protein (TIGR02145 family)